jgi:hypothetical protein
MGDEMEMTMQQAAQPTLHSMHTPLFFCISILDHSMAADSKQSINANAKICPYCIDRVAAPELSISRR